jgi:hypothetical protein
MATVYYRIKPTSAPNLSVPPVKYDQQYFNMLVNLLRLYFNQNDADWRALTSTTGGLSINFPHGDFSSNVSQTALANTPTRILLDTNEVSNDITFSSAGTITVKQAAVYNVQFSIEAQNTDTTIHTIYVWVRQNGIDVPRSASAWAVPNSHGGTPGYAVLAANFNLSMNAGDYVELWWAIRNTQVSILYQPAQTTPFAMPAIPSVIITVNYVSEL